MKCVCVLICFNLLHCCSVLQRQSRRHRHAGSYNGGNVTCIHAWIAVLLTGSANASFGVKHRRCHSFMSFQQGRSLQSTVLCHY